MSKKLVKLFLVLVWAGLGACKMGNSEQPNSVIKLTYPKGEPLAQVGTVTLTLEEMSEDFLARQGTFAGAPHLNTDEKRKEFVENQVMQEAMLQEAIALDYFNKPEVKRNIKKIVIQQLMRDKLEEVQAQYVPTDEEIQKHYNENLNLYKRAEALSVSYVMIPFGAKKDASKKIASAIQQDAAKNVKNANKKEFKQIAMNLGKSLGNLDINDSSFIEKEAFDSKFGPGTFELALKMQNVGEISQLITGATGYVVLMKNGYRKELNETMAEAHEKIKKRLGFENRGKAYEVYVEGLRKKYNVKIFDSKVAELGKSGLELIKQKADVASNN